MYMGFYQVWESKLSVPKLDDFRYILLKALLIGPLQFMSGTVSSLKHWVGE